MLNFDAARRNMVDGQIRPNGVIDQRLIDAMAELKRETFVPPSKRAFAYVDEDIALGDGRYLMEPTVMARLVQALQLQGDEVVLDIGCGAGYSAALLARLANTVVAIEPNELMRTRASADFAEVGIDNAVVLDGDLTAGYPVQAPFDAIFINGAVSHIPDHLTAQLSEAGRLVTVLAPPRQTGQGVIVERNLGNTTMRRLFDANTPYLQGFEPKPSFEF